MPDPLTELERDEDIRAAIADVERERRRQAQLRRKSRLQRFKDTMIEWGTFSSYDGVANLARADNWQMVVFWTVIVIISLIAFVYLLVVTLGQYLSYQTNVSLNLVNEKGSFPSVTICGVNAYTKRGVASRPEIQALVTLYTRVLERLNSTLEV